MVVELQFAVNVKSITKCVISCIPIADVRSEKM